MDSRTRRELGGSALVFTATALFVWWLAGNRFVPILDEGIYLDGALRIVKGQVPYRDFFVLTGPGAFWLHAALFRLLGVSFGHAHLTLVFDIAILAALVFWLTSRFARGAIAALVTICFVVFGTADPHILVLNHRWDSAVWGLSAVALVLLAAERPGRLIPAAAGLFAASAAWFTPSMGVLTLLLAAWLAAFRESRRVLPWFLAGGAVVSACSLAALAVSGALEPFIRHMLWTAANYAGPNRVPYGAVAGGYWSLLRDARGAEWFIRVLVIGCIALPAILPPLTLAGFAASFRRWPACGIPLRSVLLLLLSMTVMVVSTYPRWDIGHLLYVSPLSFVLSGWLAGACLSRRVQRLFALAPLLLAAVFAISSVQTRLALSSAATRGGWITATPQDLALIRAVEHHIPAGETLFVFPYMPVLYFFTQAENPTRYCFLQPGMMTGKDEQSVLAGLRARPPRWVVYSNIPPSSYLGLFPSSDRARLRMPGIEEFIRTNYEQVAAHTHWKATYQVLKRRESPHAAGPAEPLPPPSPPASTPRGA